MIFLYQQSWLALIKLTDFVITLHPIEFSIQSSALTETLTSTQDLIVL